MVKRTFVFPRTNGFLCEVEAQPILDLLVVFLVVQEIVVTETAKIATIVNCRPE